jgi:antirestriction protein ArdC
MPRERQGPESDPVTASLAQLERSVAAIQDSDTFRAYLTAQARFHQYSFGNVLLILAQRPDATSVAGYRTWQFLGRQVIKGEKAIRIIAPAYSKKEQVAQTGEEVERQVAFFRSAAVFDISPTEGDPLPEVAVPVLDSHAGAELYARLEGVALTEGLRVTIGHESFLQRPQLMGFYEPHSRAIYVKEAAQLQQTKTLAHELGHHFAKHQVSGPASETEAEAVSYVVLAHYGLDAGERSFPYIATWSQDKAVLKAALATIQTVSTTMIERVAGYSVAQAAEIRRESGAT